MKSKRIDCIAREVDKDTKAATTIGDTNRRLDAKEIRSGSERNRKSENSIESDHKHALSTTSVALSKQQEAVGCGQRGRANG